MTRPLGRKNDLTALARQGGQARDLVLRDVDLGGADLTNLRADGLDLTGARLDRAILRGASLRACRLDGALLEGADLTGATLRDCRLDGAKLRSATLSQVRLEDSSADGADLTGADLSGARLSETTFTRAILRRALLDGAQAHGLSLRGADLGSAVLRRASLLQPDFRGADLTNADLSGATLRGADFRGAILDATVWDGAVCTGARFDEGAPVSGEQTGPAGRAPADSASPRAAAAGVATAFEDMLRDAVGDGRLRELVERLGTQDAGPTASPRALLEALRRELAARGVEASEVLRPFDAVIQTLEAAPDDEPPEAWRAWLEEVMRSPPPELTQVLATKHGARPPKPQK